MFRIRESGRSIGVNSVGFWLEREPGNDRFVNVGSSPARLAQGIREGKIFLASEGWTRCAGGKAEIAITIKKTGPTFDLRVVMTAYKGRFPPRRGRC
jgi:hypothetical protein